MRALVVACLLLAGCSSPTACNLAQIDVSAWYFRGTLLAVPTSPRSGTEIDVREPYCVFLAEEELSPGVTRRDFKCVVCLDS